MDIPVYLVAGFLDSGKTSFINGILEDGFAREDRTLLICCEEGDEEYEKKALDNVTVVTVDDEEELTLAFCKELEKKHRPKQVLIEYNGIFSGNPTLEIISCYLDACCSAVGIANGLFILFRYREQWVAWYICTILETILNIMAGQWILLILKAGYLTNTTYGYIKWTKYIKKNEADRQALQKAQA